MSILAISLGLVKFEPNHNNARMITHGSDGKYEHTLHRVVPDYSENKQKIIDALNKGYAIASLIKADTGLGLTTCRKLLQELADAGLVQIIPGNKGKQIPHRYFAV